MLGNPRSVLLRNGIAQRSERGSYIFGKCLRLLQGGKMPVCHEMGQLIKTRFLRAPIKSITPIIYQPAHERQAYTVLRIDLKNYSRKPGISKPPLEVVDLLFRYLNCKGAHGLSPITRLYCICMPPKSSRFTRLLRDLGSTGASHKDSARDEVNEMIRSRCE